MGALQECILRHTDACSVPQTSLCPQSHAALKILQDSIQHHPRTDASDIVALRRRGPTRSALTSYCRYIDALLRRRGSRGRGWTIGAQAPPQPIPAGKRGGAALADEISGLVAGSAPAPESDEEEEKDHYFSDASDDADGLAA